MIEGLKIISGGQTGVDRAALDFAIEHDIKCGGYCTKGRKSEDGTIPLKYLLIEIDSSEYLDRTKKNILESDGTLIIKDNSELIGGTLSTIQICKKQGKPYIVIDIDKNFNSKGLKLWLTDHNVKVLNIAGNRESNSPGIHKKAYKFLESLFKWLL